mgnify:CR=1 FL=1
MTQATMTDAYKKMMDEQLSRMEAAFAESAKLEQKSAEQTRAAIDEWAKLARESLAYPATLAAEWRKIMLETTRRSFEAMSPKG